MACFDGQVHELLEAQPGAQSRLELYPGCGHVPMDDCRERFEADVTEFVAGVFAAGPAAASAQGAVDGNITSASLQKADAGAVADAVQADPDAQLQVLGKP